MGHTPQSTNRKMPKGIKAVANKHGVLRNDSTTELTDLPAFARMMLQLTRIRRHTRCDKKQELQMDKQRTVRGDACYCDR